MKKKSDCFSNLGLFATNRCFFALRRAAILPLRFFQFFITCAYRHFSDLSILASTLLIIIYCYQRLPTHTFWLSANAILKLLLGRI